MRRFVLLVPVALAVAVGGCNGGGLFDPFRSNEAKITANNVLQIGLALHNFHDSQGYLPIYGIGTNGTPVPSPSPKMFPTPGKGGMPFPPPPPAQTELPKRLLSWRVAILPYIEQNALYRQFKLDEPWDSEHNKKLIPLMPKIYASVAKDAPEGHTYWQQVVGPGGVRPAEVWSFVRFKDGTSNTAAVVEAAEPVPWTKPADIEVPKEFAPGALKAKFAGQFKGGFFVLLWDGSVYFARDDADETALKHLCTPTGGEVMNHDLWRLFAEDGRRNR